MGDPERWVGIRQSAECETNLLGRRGVKGQRHETGGRRENGNTELNAVSAHTHESMHEMTDTYFQTFRQSSFSRHLSSTSSHARYFQAYHPQRLARSWGR